MKLSFNITLPSMPRYFKWTPSVKRCVLFCVLCLIVPPLPPGTDPSAVKINNNNNKIIKNYMLFSSHPCTLHVPPISYSSKWSAYNIWRDYKLLSTPDASVYYSPLLGLTTSFSFLLYDTLSWTRHKSINTSIYLSSQIVHRTVSANRWNS
jgi:hypothetical protein